MSEGILIEILGLIGILISSIITTKNGYSKVIAEMKTNQEVSDAKTAGQIELVKTELADLKRETEKHNKVIERTYKLEKDVAIIKLKLGINGGNSDKE